MTRRAFIKWTTALGVAGAAVIGAGAGYGSDLLLRPAAQTTTTKTETKSTTVTQSGQATTVTLPAQTSTATTTRTVTAPVTTLSFKPPLSADVQSRVNQILQSTAATKSSDQIVYTNCKTNGCIATTCVLKAHVRNGVVTLVEPDDSSVNPNNAREDISLDLIKKGRVRYAGCPIGVSQHAEEYLPTRILYPMKRVGARGEGKFVRISWDEALTQISSDINDTVNKYGPYSIWQSPWGVLNGTPGSGFVFGNYMPGGVSSWGDHSFSAVSIPRAMAIASSPALSPADVLYSKLVILWGKNSSRTEQVTWPYLIRRAKEAGTKVIYIDPRYAPSTEALADQWIPIRPGTDLALMLAIANVWFKENLTDTAFITANVDQPGLAKFKDYVLGNAAGPDGAIDRTPEWQEKVTGVPAATARDLARLYAKSKPVKLLFGLGMFRQDYLNSSRVGVFLQALSGNLTVSGGGEPFMHNHSMSAAAGPMPSVNWNRKYTQTMPTLINLLRWHDAILYRQQYDAGKISAADFNGAVGNKADSKDLPNIQMVAFDCNYLNNQFDVNKRIQALKSIAHVWGFQWYSDQPTGKYLDVMLPAPVWFLEDPGTVGVRWKSGGTFNSHFMYLAPAIPPDKLPGEVRPVEWVLIQLADRLGFAANYNPTLYPTVKGAWNPTVWETAVVAAHKTAYETWAANAAIKPLNPPTWDAFLKNPVFYLDAPYVPPYDPSVSGTTPWKASASNLKNTDLIEIYNPFLDDHAKVANTVFGTTCLGKVGDAVTGVPMWNYDMYGSYYDHRTKNYPLVLLTLESGFRSHSAHFNNPLLKDDSYRHAVWLSAADASARGINDGDQVRVYSNTGEAVLEAYVTNRLLPGVAAIGHGGWYAPNSTKTALNPDGVDKGGAPNILLEDVQPDKMTIGPSLDKGVCQVEKF